MRVTGAASLIRRPLAPPTARRALAALRRFSNVLRGMIGPISAASGFL
jgi:hypothetical protein